MDNFNAHKWFKKEYLGEGHTDDKIVAATKDGRIEFTQKQMERIHNGEVVRLSNGSVLGFVKEGHTEDKMERDMEARKRSRLSPGELKKLDAMRAFYRGETDVLPAELKEDDLNESMIESQFDDLNQVIRNIHHVGEYDSLEEAAAEAMERIGQEFGIDFEFGRDY